MPSSLCSSCRSRVRGSRDRCLACGAPNWKRLGKVPAFRMARWAGWLGGGALGAWLGVSVLGGASQFIAFGLAGLFALASAAPVLRRQEGGCLLGGLGLGALAATLLTPAAVWPLMAGVLAGGLGGWLGGKLLRRILSRVLHGKASEGSLKATEKLIRSRIGDLRKRFRRLQRLHADAPPGVTGTADVATEVVLAEGQHQVQEQLARYGAQLWRTGYARWREQVVALAEDAQAGAVESGAAAELTRLDEAGRRMLNKALADVELLGTEDGQDGVERLRETLAGLENLRRQVVMQVAVSESTGAPTADATAFDAAALEPRIFEALHAEGTAGDLFSDLDALEREHRQLAEQLSRQASKPKGPRPRGRTRS